ncbi:MAG: polysaccharide export protein [Symploca sp. SIO1C4]|uniref:Polysaccharide export protein n=1 Tax=Symploca sp. SIO1C4 TaxID=2607765 RepID=A0A6B3NAS1_9CYAN|nr:polysaccharide export protein [Symploca sp. SIO1C4]
MNPTPKPHKLPLFQGNRLITLSSTAVSKTAFTLVGAMLLWSAEAGVIADVGQSQSLPELTGEQSEQVESNGAPEDQVPVIIPAEILEFNVPDPNAPPPPLGYQDLFLQNNQPTAQFNRYRLGSGDTLQIQVERFPDLSFAYTIDIQGNIVVPLLGQIRVGGKTVEEVQETIRAGLDRFVVDPKVSVVVSGFRPAEVTITGEVQRPGFYTLQPGSTINEALLAAGGTTNDADLRKVVVRRRALFDDSILEQQLDLFTPLQNATDQPNLILQDGDALIVLQLESQDVTDYDRTLASRSSFAQAQINVRVLNYPGERIGNVTLPNGSNFVDAFTAIAPNLDDANVRKIALIRFDPERGKAVTQILDGKKALLGDISQNVPLQNDDVIVVGRNLVAKITNLVDRITRPFTDVLNFQRFFEDAADQLGGGD